MNPCVTLSNRLENLLLKLQDRLFADTDLRQKTVVVASRGMKRWVKGKILASRGSFFGLTLLTMEEFLQEKIGKESLAAQLYGSLPEVEEISNYLNGGEENRVFLSIHLASLFLSYKELGFIPPKDHWQHRLYRQGAEKVLFPKGDLYFFGFSHLPKPLLDQISHCPSYILTPTLQFWEELKKEEHPLLGSLGKMGRVMARHLPQDGNPLFSLPQEVAEHPAYSLTGEELVEDRPMTLLTALQADLLLMREGEKVELPNDQTVQIHVTPSIEREVEVLRDRLFQLMGQEGVAPGEILVMAKDISPYLPLLKGHFEKKGLPFRVAYQEANVGSGSLEWGLLHKLLHLKQRRFQANDLLSFFSSDIVRKALSLSQEEIEGLETIIEEGAIFWGWDQKERDETVPNNRDRQGSSGSFTEGFERVWQQLLSFKGDQIPLNDPLPLSFAETLEGWISRLNTLRQHLLRPDHQSMKRWCLWLGKLIDLYFAKAGELFDETLNQLAIEDETDVPFSFFFHFLEKGVESMEATQGSNDWDAILFTSLGPMRAVPKRVIWLLGMEEEHFPSKEPPNYGDLAALEPDKISSRDQDRYAFLETVLSSRERLMISYVTPLLVHPTHGEASIPLQELIAFLDRQFLVDGLPFSKVGVQIHPRSRFEADPLISEVDAALLQPFQPAPLEKRPPPFNREVKVKDLLIFARDPAQTYFRNYFETTLPYFQAKLPSIEPFGFSKELKWALDKNKVPAALSVSFEGKALTEGRLYQTEREAFINGKKPFKVFLEKNCQKPFQDGEGNWILPPLTIEGWTVTGPLGILSEEGILVEGDVKDHYPLLLISQLLPFRVPPVFHCIDTKKTVSATTQNPQEELKVFLEGYLVGLQEPNMGKKSRYSEVLG